MDYHQELLRRLREIGESPEGFDAVDALGYAEDETQPLNHAMVEVGLVLEDQLGEVFDTFPRSAAMQACFMYGVLLGSELAQKGVILRGK